MKIAVIGTGNVGQALGGSLVRAGHDVTYAGRHADKTNRVASELGATAADTPVEAVAGADVVILAVPYASLAEVAGEIAPEAAGKVIVDMSNPIRPDYSGLANAGGESAAEEVAGKLTNARVAKAFNTIFSGLQARPGALGTQVDALFATDDDEARRTLSALIDSLGFRPVDAGALEAARQMEAMAWLNIRLQLQHGGDWQSTFVLLGAPAGATPTREREPATA